MFFAFFSFLANQFWILFCVSGIRGLEMNEVQTPFTKDKLKFFSSLSHFFKYHKIFIIIFFLFRFSCQFYVRLFSMLFVSILFLGFTVQQIKTRHQPP